MGKSSKPKGIKTIAIVVIILSGLSLISGVQDVLSLIFPSQALLSALDTFGFPKSTLIYLIAINLASFVLNLLFIIAAIGLLKYKEWGRKMTIYVSIGFLLESTASLIYSAIYPVVPLAFVTILSFIVTAIVYGLAIFYFSKKNVREAFS